MTSKSSRRQQRRLPAPFHPLNPTRAVFAGAAHTLSLSIIRGNENRRDTWGARERDDAQLLLLPSTRLPSSSSLVFRTLPLSLPPPSPSSFSSPGAGFAQISPFIFLRRSRKSLRCLLRARLRGKYLTPSLSSFLFPCPRPRISPSRRARTTLSGGV